MEPLFFWCSSFDLLSGSEGAERLGDGVCPPRPCECKTHTPGLLRSHKDAHLQPYVCVHSSPCERRQCDRFRSPTAFPRSAMRAVVGDPVAWWGPSETRRQRRSSSGPQRGPPEASSPWREVEQRSEGLSRDEEKREG